MTTAELFASLNLPLASFCLEERQRFRSSPRPLTFVQVTALLVEADNPADRRLRRDRHEPRLLDFRAEPGDGEIPVAAVEDVALIQLDSVQLAVLVDVGCEFPQLIVADQRPYVCLGPELHCGCPHSCFAKSMNFLRSATMNRRPGSGERPVSHVTAIAPRPVFQ